MANRQTAAYGRQGRSWKSPEGGLYFSFILDPLGEHLQPKVDQNALPTLSLLLSLAVQETLASFAQTEKIKIKWPNDIVVHGKKLCGILTEMTTEEMRMTGIVVGIGINTGITDFEEELKDKATSLALEVAKPDEVDRLTVFGAVLRQFQSCYERFMQTRDLSLLIDDYNARCITVGHRVRVEEGASAFEAWAQAVDAHGELVVRMEDETSRTVCAGEVSVRGVMGYV